MRRVYTFMALLKLLKYFCVFHAPAAVHTGWDCCTLHLQLQTVVVRVFAGQGASTNTKKINHTLASLHLEVCQARCTCQSTAVQSVFPQHMRPCTEGACLSGVASANCISSHSVLSNQVHQQHATCATSRQHRGLRGMHAILAVLQDIRPSKAQHCSILQLIQCNSLSHT